MITYIAAPILGMFYGCSFVYQHKRASVYTRTLGTLLTMLRLTIFLCIGKFLLHITLANSILVLLLFTAGFFGVIFFVTHKENKRLTMQ